MLVELQCSENHCLKYHEKVTTGSVSEKMSLKHHPKMGKSFFMMLWRTDSKPAAAAVSLQSCPILYDPIDGSQPGFLSLGFSRQEHWSGLPFPSPMHKSEKWKWSCSVVSDSSDPMDCSLPGSSVHGIFYAKVLEWGAIAFSGLQTWNLIKPWSWVSNLLSYTSSGRNKSSCMSQTNPLIQSGKDLPSLRRLQKCCFFPLNSFPGGIPLIFPIK